MPQSLLYLYSLLIYIPPPGFQHVIAARICAPPFFCRQAADLVRIIHFCLPSCGHRRNCGPSFCRQAADLVRLLHLGLFRAAHWLDCDPFFVDRLRTWCMCPILGLPLVLIGSIARPLFVDRLRTSCAYLILGFPLAPIGLIVTLFYVPRLRTCCVYLILGFSRAPAGPTLAVYGDPLTLSRLHFMCAGCVLAACSLPRALVDSTVVTGRIDVCPACKNMCCLLATSSHIGLCMVIFCRRHTTRGDGAGV